MVFAYLLLLNEDDIISILDFVSPLLDPQWYEKTMENLQTRGFVRAQVALDIDRDSAFEVILRHVSEPRLLAPAMDICDEDVDKWVSLCSELLKQHHDDGVHDCFREITKKGRFLEVFNRLLATAQDLACVGSIRGILRDVFASYAYELEMLRISLRMLNEDIFASMETIRIDTIRGWAPTKKCLSCSRDMWGNEVDEDHYIAWEDRKREMLFVRKSDDKGDNIDDKGHNIDDKGHNIDDKRDNLDKGDNIDDKRDNLDDKGHNIDDKRDNLDVGFSPSPGFVRRWHHCQLVYFKCGHGYHSVCLEGLGGGECVVCGDN